MIGSLPLRQLPKNEGKGIGVRCARALFHLRQSGSCVEKNSKRAEQKKHIDIGPLLYGGSNSHGSIHAKGKKKRGTNKKSVWRVSSRKEEVVPSCVEQTITPCTCLVECLFKQHFQQGGHLYRILLSFELASWSSKSGVQENDRVEM